MPHTMPTSVPRMVAVVYFLMRVFSSLCACLCLDLFPFYHSLQLMQHITECHDPLAEIQRERGDKTVCIVVQPSPPLPFQRVPPR